MSTDAKMSFALDQVNTDAGGGVDDSNNDKLRSSSLSQVTSVFQSFTARQLKQENTLSLVHL